MATRPGFYILNGQVTCKKGDFEWAGGFAVSQKKKNVVYACSTAISFITAIIFIKNCYFY